MPEIVDASASHVMAWAPAAMLYVWRAEPTMAGVEAAAAAMDAARASTPGGDGVLLGLVEEGTPPPASDVRKALADVMSGGEGFYRASALVFEGTGFQASMVRMVATGLARLARQPFPHQVFADVPAATVWLQSRCDAIRARRLQTLIAEARAA